MSSCPTLRSTILEVLHQSLQLTKVASPCSVFLIVSEVAEGVVLVDELFFLGLFFFAFLVLAGSFGHSSLTSQITNESHQPLINPTQATQPAKMILHD